MSTKTEQYLSPEDMEKQENLSLQRLVSLTPKDDTYSNVQEERPAANFIDLMEWVERNFSSVLKDKEGLEKFVHNRVIIDGQFMQFCEENNVTVETLYKDSLISWKTEHDFEKFFAQGIFLIKAKGVEFLHAALFHKGNQNEDEISFFVIASQKNVSKYVELRNQFDEWVLERDRGNLHVRVIEGDDIPYTKDSTWEELFLPKEIKDEVKGLVENFLASKDFYLKNRIPWKRGILLYGKPGNGKTSIIRTIMSMYNFKPVTVVAGANDEAVREAFTYAEEQSPALLYFEDLDSLLEKSLDPSSFLNLMDGISAKNGLLVVATANEVKKLKANVTDRPSRFDRKFEIPLPNTEMAYIYLRRWFGNLITLKKCKELAKYASKHEFSYAYLKELYISSMFEALANDRKAPTEKDVSTALNRLIKDKNLLNSGSINMDKYFKG
jgi:ATPase family associated with various cellular activities (AAA)